MASLEEVIKRKISVPVYAQEYINKNLNLNETQKICCPFHKENTPSFVYSPEKKTWRCFGACGVGGDVIALHQKNKGFKSRDEAITDLAFRYKLEAVFTLTEEPDKTNWDDVELFTLMRKCEEACKTADDYCDYDVVMSYFEPLADRVRRLKRFYDNLSNRST